MGWSVSGPGNIKVFAAVQMMQGPAGGLEGGKLEVGSELIRVKA